MDSAKIFALGLAAGLTIAVGFVAHSKTASKEAQSASTATKGSKNKKKKAKAGAAADTKKADEEHEVAPKPLELISDAPVSTPKQSKKAKKQNRPAEQEPASYANAAAIEVDEASTAVAQPKTMLPLSNEAVRQKQTAHHAVLHSALGDMRDPQVDPIPASYNSVARIPPPAAARETELLSEQDKDEGWSSVGASGGRIKPPSAQQQNGNANKSFSSVASANPFAALPDDAATSTVKRLPKTAAPSVRAPAASSRASTAAAEAETKKQRQNAQKAQAKKQAKEQAERERLDRLAEHRREQQREAAKQRDMAKRPTPHSTSSKQPSAKASVDLNGRLVWE